VFLFSNESVIGLFLLGEDAVFACRFKKFVGQLADDQKAFVQESGFGMGIVGVSEFWFEGRSIRFRPSMVAKVLGISSGNEPIKFDAEVC
jgi:hypothetical protein